MANAHLKEDTLDYVEMCMKRYGTKTIESRAIPDYRDGLLPVQRRIMWAAFNLGNTKLKSARLVGDGIGRYSPHGDSAFYGAIVKMIQAKTPLLKGYGNWGSYLKPDGNAAYRYTEYTISEFAKKHILNSDNMGAVEYVANFDGTDKEPVILHTNIPMLLVKGSLGGIAVGVTCNIPAYTPETVAYITAKYLKTGKITVADCMKLDFNFAWGGTVAEESIEELKEFYKTGSATVKFVAEYEVKANRVIITGLPPHLDVEKAIEKATDFSIGDRQLISGKAIDLSDENGIHIEFILNSKMGATKDAKEFINRVFKSSIPLRCNVTKRNITEESIVGGADLLDTEFSSSTILQIVQDWSEYRKEVEKTIRKQKIQLLSKENHNLNLLIIARKYIDIIMEAVKLDTTTDNMYQYLLDNIDVELTLDDVKYIMSRPIISLSKTDITKTRNKIKENKATILEHKEIYKNPTNYLVSLLKDIAKG